MSIRPKCVRKMIGEVLAMPFQATLDILVQLVVSDLKSINFRPAQREQKARPVQPGDFSGPGLGDYSARYHWIAAASRSSVINASSEPLSSGLESSGISTLMVFNSHSRPRPTFLKEEGRPQLPSPLSSTISV